jgi:ethanolamine-phosphate cytidylyltransferase
LYTHTPKHTCMPHTPHHSTQGLSTFLPTTWRIAQFGNGRIPKADDVVVYLDGGFDLFHVGHIETIKKAKALGTFLYVGIHDDQTVNRTRGSNFPIMNLHERVLNVLSCKYVDEVVIGAPWTVTKDLMTSLNIGIVADASAANDDAPTGLSYPYAYPAESKKLQKLETTNAFTTDNIIKRIIAGHEKYKARQKKKVKKDQDYFQGEKTYVQEY